MLKLFCFPLISLALLMACVSHNGAREQAWEKKVDPHLRAALRQESAQALGAESVHVLLKCAAPLSHEQKKQLASLGVRLQAEAGAIVTATIPGQAITKVAKLDYVVYLELSKERKISSPEN
jgi:hypothetical protein